MLHEAILPLDFVEGIGLPNVLNPPQEHVRIAPPRRHGDCCMETTPDICRCRCRMPIAECRMPNADAECRCRNDADIYLAYFTGRGKYESLEYSYAYCTTTSSAYCTSTSTFHSFSNYKVRVRVPSTVRVQPANLYSRQVRVPDMGHTASSALSLFTLVFPIQKA